MAAAHHLRSGAACATPDFCRETLAETSASHSGPRVWHGRPPVLRTLRSPVLIHSRIAKCSACETGSLEDQDRRNGGRQHSSSTRPDANKERGRVKRGCVPGNEADTEEASRAPAVTRRAALLAAASAATFWETAQKASIALAAATPVDPVLDELKKEIRKAVTLAKAPGVLRLVFHDGFTYNPATQTGGPNGSVIFELDRPENEGLKRSVRPLEKVKATLGDKVSWADIIAVAGAEVVAMTGGPVIPVRLGRMDQGAADPEDQMPPETLDAGTLKTFFHSRNYTTQEMVVLSGAHTLGGKGFGNSTTFDNDYYKILLDKPWETATAMTTMIGLKTDRALPDDEECRKWVKLYAEDQGRFFRDFASAYDKLVTQGVSWKSGTA